MRARTISAIERDLGVEGAMRHVIQRVGGAGPDYVLRAGAREHLAAALSRFCTTPCAGTHRRLLELVTTPSAIFKTAYDEPGRGAA